MGIKIYKISKNEWIKFAYTYNNLNTDVTFGVFVVDQESTDQYYYITDREVSAIFRELRRPYFFKEVKLFGIPEFIKIIDTKEWILGLSYSRSKKFFATSKFNEKLIEYYINDKFPDISILDSHKFLLGILKEEIIL